MMRKILLLSLLFLLAACGTVATPVFEAPEEADHGEAAVEAEGETQATEVVIQPTNTSEPPTPTPEPPTATPTEEPTEAPTEEVTEEAVAEEPAAEVGADDPLKFLVDLANPANGDTLFHTDFETSTGVWQCATCHNVDIDEVKIGPSLLGLPGRAGDRVEGEGPYTYIFNSIKYSQQYIVEGFENATHMPNYEGILTDIQIYDLVAYLMTLEN